jgi:SulP family sulfate permease
LKNIYIKEILAGIVVFLALLPEALGFTLVAGVDPIYGIISCFFMSLTTSISRARPGMISAAAGATALVLAPLVQEYGVEYLLYATLLAGVIQVLLFRVNYKKIFSSITKPIIQGFLNGLGILMFITQLHNFNTPLLLIIGCLTLLLIHILAKSPIPSPIISLVIVTVFTFNLAIPRLSDMGSVAFTGFDFMLDLSLFNLNTLIIVLPVAISVALIGLIESILTANVVEEKIQGTTNYQNIALSQGTGNILNGLFGGIAGCGMIGQSIMNLKYGGTKNLSIFIAGTTFLLAAMFIPMVLGFLPLAGLSAIMIMISIETFSFESIKEFKTYNIEHQVILITTTTIVVLTHNLFFGVLAGVFVQKIFTFSK